LFIKRIQLGLIHVAVAMTLVPINSTLNRVMIKELALSATLVAVLASLPYLFSPIQVAIGSFSDRHPLWGMRRTPYIVLGLGLCVLGVVFSPTVAFTLSVDWWAGVGLGVLTFGAWGMGFNFATVSYLSLATELSGENGRGRTISTMWFMMISSIILTAVALSHMVDPYTPQALVRSFWVIGVSALILGSIGLVKLESGVAVKQADAADTHSWGTLTRTILENRQAKTFFWYLIILLAAILGQDILLEPFGGEAFGMSVKATTRITSIWGTCVLVSLLAAGLLEGRVSKRSVAFRDQWSGAKPIDFLFGCADIRDWYRPFDRFKFVFDAGYDHCQQCWVVYWCLGNGECCFAPGWFGLGRCCQRSGYQRITKSCEWLCPGVWHRSCHAVGLFIPAAPDRCKRFPQAGGAALPVRKGCHSE
jgi:BCD family chlorophyll transporter-like MFS transporter